MKLEAIKVAVKEICLKYDYPIPFVKINPRLTKSIGRYIFYSLTNQHVIEIAKAFNEFAKDEDVLDVLKHEIAHIKHPNHGFYFKMACRQMGVTRERLGTTSKTDGYAAHLFKSGRLKANVKYICPNGHETLRTKLYKEIYSCGQCSEDFDERYLLTRVY